MNNEEIIAWLEEREEDYKDLQPLNEAETELLWAFVEYLKRDIKQNG